MNETGERFLDSRLVLRGVGEEIEESLSLVLAPLACSLVTQSQKPQTL